MNERNNNVILGCIADDFTGGSDAASFLSLGGMNTLLLTEIPNKDFSISPNAEAIVIALKSRTQETSGAINDSLNAIKWLESIGVSHYYIKYCSTFDSTPKGNIGPIVDAVIEYLDADGTILCPALPANGRIVKDGILYVKGVPLAESPMKDHPLTPMWESRISKLMEPQGKYQLLELNKNTLHSSESEINILISDFKKDKQHWYFIPDYEDEDDANRIVELFGNMKVLSGGSGILTALARKLSKHKRSEIEYSGTTGPAIIVAGSCSTATHAQTVWYESHGGFSLKLDDDKVLNGEHTPASIWNIIKDYEAPLVYSYDTPEGLKKKRNEEGKVLAAKIEDTLAKTVSYSLSQGVTRVIVAGGETSGAVTKALGYNAYYIGKSVAPGVPVMTPVDNPNIRLVLKSGNFGQEDFFDRALKLTSL